MITLKNVSWKSYIIALGFIVIIPVIVSLGIDLIAPNVNWENYSKDQAIYVTKNHGEMDDEKRQEIEKQQSAAWQNSAEFKMYKTQQFEHVKTENIVGCLAMLLLLILVGFLQSSCIAISFAIASIIIYFRHVGLYSYTTTMYNFGSIKNITIFGISMIIWQILIVFISLLLVLWYVYRDMNKAD